MYHYFRYFSQLVFWLPVLCFFIIGIIFSKETKEGQLLHRDQTDEWKGEMYSVFESFEDNGA